MKKIMYLILFILVSLSATALNDTVIYQSQYIIVDTDFFTALQIEQTGPRATIEDLAAEIAFFPIQTEHQRILSSGHSPLPKTIDEQEPAMRFSWNKPSGTLPIHIKNRVQVESTPKKIREKISFPLAGLPDDIQKFTQPAAIIDSNADIVRLASTLAQGQDDTLVVVDNIAVWVTANIKYNLSSAAADATEKASTVLRTREGVCDELTALFISMLRALGIPARFVAGIAYSNSPELNGWGPHGWTEVYFPNYGWVPYDVTYGQYGFVDASHIVTRYSADSEKIKSKFTWKGRDTTVTVRDFSTKATVQEYGPLREPHIALTAEPFKGSVGFGSYNLVIAHVRNLLDYYQPVDVHVSKTTKLEIMDESAPTENAKYKKHILLAPHEEKILFWTIKTSSELENNLIYTFPVSVYTPTGMEAVTEFKAVKDGIQVPRERIEKTMQGLAPADNNMLTHGLILNCASAKQTYQEDEPVAISCAIKNNGNTFLGQVNVCADGKQCQTIDVGIAQEQQLHFELTGAHDAGENAATITAMSDDAVAKASVGFFLLDKPLLKIEAAEAPATVHYGDEFTATLRLTKGSSTAPQNVHVTVHGELVAQEFDLGTLDSSLDLTLAMQGSDLQPDTNVFTVTAAFTDEKGTPYETTNTFTVTLVDVTAWQRIKIFVKSLFT
ncbi:MAG: transglutaminase domain-containing protein [Candidatus Woesearchaeota archaeon]|nr:transglutaminase domain-containing protein [Candidatus Woesearchaeota archaeon]